MNRKALLVSSAAIGLFSLSNAALASDGDTYRVSGEVGVSAGATFSDFHSEPYYCHCNIYSDSGATFVFGGEGRVNTWLANDMSMQLDVRAEGTTGLPQGYRGADGRVDGMFAGHLSWRNEDHLLGVFAGLTAAVNNDYDGTMTFVPMGVEGQYYSGQWTLYGQAGYEALMSNSDEYEPNGLGFGRAVVRYFWSDNDKLQAEFAYAGGPVRDHSGDYSIYTWGASYEHRYAGTPFSAGIDYSGFYNDRSTSPNWAQENVVMAVFKIHFGDETEIAQDRDGATLDMPNFNRAVAWSYWLGR